jgi:surface antigen
LRLPHFDLSLLRDANTAAIPAVPTAALVPMTGSWFVARVNRPLLDTLQAAEARLLQTRTQIAALTEQRTGLVSDLAALRNRLLSHDPQTDLNQVRPLRMMQQQAQQLEQEIVHHEQQAAELNGEIALLRERLDRVQPAAGADWSVIRQMEQQQTPSYVLDNTYDCVRYVVGRVNIPDGLALNAYQWHEAAAQMPQLGIRVSDVPLVGAILQMDPQHSYADDAFGHVMVVERVQGGEVWVTDNVHPDVPVRLSDLTQETGGAYLRYLYLPWHTRG